MAIREIFEKYAKQVRIVYYHKKYALACKFFEYVYEPVISNYNSIFYRTRFNRFVANLFYSIFQQEAGTAEDIFNHFQELLRGNSTVALFNYLQNHRPADPFTSLISEFTLLHKETILDEITTDGKVDSWVLDLSQTALYDLLCFWSEEIGSLTVICDKSEPLVEAVEKSSLFRTPHTEVKHWNPLGDGEVPLNFTLKEQINFASSKKFYGLQLADVFASSTNWALKNVDDPLSKYISEFLPKIFERTANRCIIPEPDLYLQPGSREFDFGAMTLNRLTEFSREDKSKTVELFIKWLQKSAEQYGKLPF